MPFIFTDKQKAVAMFIFIGTFLAIVMSALVAKGSDLLSSKKVYFTIFSDTHGLKGGTDITYRGFSVGKIQSMSLNREDNIVAYFYIYDKYKRLIQTNTVLRLTSSVLGASTLIVVNTPNPMAELLSEGRIVYSSDMPEGQKILKREVEATDAGDELADKVKTLLDDMHQLTPTLEEALDNTARTMANLADISGAANPDDVDRIMKLIGMNLIELRKTLKGFQAVFGQGSTP